MYMLSTVWPFSCSRLKVYIQYLRFARRTGGVKAARNVFRKAREDTKTGYQVFVAAAMMEYYSSKDPNIAFKVFELGLKVRINQ